MCDDITNRIDWICCANCNTISSRNIKTSYVSQYRLDDMGVCVCDFYKRGDKTENIYINKKEIYSHRHCFYFNLYIGGINVKNDKILKKIKYV